jgi:hypothetical protein
MYNLLEIQDALKGLRPEEVMKYANGTSPSVPAYLALSELNRRKQLQDTASAFYGEPQSVKDQLASSLTKAPAGVNPTAAPAQVNPAGVPPQLAVQQPPPTQAPAQQMGQVDPTAAPPRFAGGGLSTLPVGMFKQANYAGGGIVAFADGGAAAQRQGALDVLKTNMPDIPPDYRGSLTEYLSNPENAQAYETNQRDREIARKAILSNNPLPSLNRDILNPSQSIRAQADEQKLEAPKEVAKEEPTGIKSVVNPNQQASATSSGQLPINTAIERLSSKVAPNGQPLTEEQFFERRKALEKLAGVSEDPYADIRSRYAKIEEGRAKQAEGDPMDRLMYRLAALSQSKDIDFGVSMGESALKTAAYEKEQNALRDKQASDMAGLQKEIVKEDNARKRGDVTAVEEARKNQEDIRLKLRKLDIDEQVAKAQMAHYGSMGANAGVKENPLVTQATRYYFEQQMIPAFKKQFPTVGDYLRSQGLTPNASIGSASAPAGNLPPTVTKDGKTYILQPNGKYIEKP